MTDEAKTRDQLFDEIVAIRGHNQLLISLQDCAIALSKRSPPDLDDGLIEVAELASRLMNTPHAFVSCIKPSVGKPEFRAGCGRFSQNTKDVEKLIDEVWQANHSVVADNLISVPLRDYDHLIGVIGLAYDNESGRRFDNFERKVLEMFADLVASAIRQTLEIRNIQEKVAKSNIFHWIRSKISPPPVLNLDTMKILCEEMVNSLGANYGNIALLNSTKTNLTIVAEYGIDEGQSEIGNVVNLSEDHFLKQVIESSVIIDEQDVSNVAIPLFVNSEIIGIMNFRAEPEQIFPIYTIEFVENIGSTILEGADKAQIDEFL